MGERLTKRKLEQKQLIDAIEGCLVDGIIRSSRAVMEDKKHLDRGHVYMLRELSSGLVALEGLYNDLFN